MTVVENTPPSEPVIDKGLSRCIVELRVLYVVIVAKNKRAGKIGMQGGEGRLRPEKSSTLAMIQVFRAVAAYMVVVHHSTIMYTERLNKEGFRWLNGAAGVDIFFVISGLVMCLSSEKLIKRTHVTRYFLARRIERIIPLYWLITTIKVCLLIAVPAVAVHALGTTWHLVASYLFIPSYNADGIVEPVLVAGWTLSFEMLFYLLFALALALHLTPLKLLMPVLASMAVGSFFIHHLGESPVLTLCSPLVLEFLYGSVLAMFFRSRRLPNERLCWLILIVSFAVLLFTPSGGGTQLRALIWGLPAAAIILAALGLESRLKDSIPAWVLESGDASYSIYLTHGFALTLIGMVLVRLSLPHQFLLPFAIVFGLLASAALGELTYRFIEKPIIDYFGLRRRPIASTQS